MFLSILNFILFLQIGGADKDMYNNAAEDNSFIGTIGAIIVGGIIWWLIISTSNNKKR
ncbi:hypothetical protein [Confluentibacter citreus]|uniref:hypothetical protein n=1 Tax=Confluentibacter citreus TaxID=2007307 RepID=UPI0012FDF765|nr:hypothetical protein [Confluentibacter citreus]